MKSTGKYQAFKIIILQYCKFHELLMKSLGLFLLVFILNNYCEAQDTIPEVKNLGPDTLFFCSDSVRVAPDISIKNVEFENEFNGIRISVVDFIPGSDTILFKEIHDFTYSWNTNGYLDIKGSGSLEQYENAIQNVFYGFLGETDTFGYRKLAVSFLDIELFLETQHFYRFIKKDGIPWNEARDSAQNLNYKGMQGYLATITSEEENDFIWSRIEGVGWIGASDEEDEGFWKWVTGPEAGTVFWQGRGNGFPVNGEFSFWAEGEPNNYQNGEHYAHINQHPGFADKSWNDYKNEGGSVDTHYYPRGFIVEFGGMEEDPEVVFSDTIVLSWAEIPFSEIQNYGICPGDSIQLNQIEMGESAKYEFEWQPNEGIDSLFVPSPFVSPKDSTVYEVIGKIGQCTANENFTVHVLEGPVADFEAVPPAATISYPVITFENKSEGAIKYEWDFGDFTAISGETDPVHYFNEIGQYLVNLTVYDDIGCVDTTSKAVSVLFDGVFPPTAFSPNAAKTEDREFRIYNSGIGENGYHLIIYNRWGDIVYESFNKEKGWNGKMKNDIFAPAGVYTWVLSYQNHIGEKFKQRGTVTLLF